MNDFILKLLEERYFLENEKNWEQLSERVGSIYPDIIEDIKRMNFIPSSPTLMHAGAKEKNGTLSSCFPMGIKDSIDDIFNSLKECALVTKAGGGIGIDATNLRSSKENIKTLGNKKSSGPLPFLEVFNSMLDGVNQGGSRRGAGMALLSIEHPDILDFIKIKEDLTKINRFNLSVKIPSYFYKKLKEYPNSIHRVKYIDGEFVDLVNSNGEKITTQQIWDLIIEHAHRTAEPGIFNETIAYDRCANTNLDNMVASNPCLRNSVNLLTKSGLKQLKDVNIGDYIWSKEGWTKILAKFKTGEKRVYKYYTTAGVFESTDNHEIISKGIKIPISDSDSIDILVGNYEKKMDIYPEYIMDGLVLGDGSVHKASNNLIYLCIGCKDTDYFDSEINHLILKDRTIGFKYGWEIKTSLKWEEIVKTYNRHIPKRYLYMGRDYKYSFLRGLYSANGSICGNRVSYKTSSFTMVKDIQLLLSSLGIRSYYTKNKPKKIKFKNGIYECKESYDINITVDREKFYESIGFLQKYKMDALKIIINNKEKNINKVKENFDIYNVKDIGVFEVFDITVDNKSHTFWCDGFNISNCGEFINIPYTSCSLGSINLYNLVNNKKFNWNKFGDLISRSIRFIDSGIDINKFPLEKIKERTLKTRPVGLGFMGLAHAMYACEIPYASEEGLLFSEEIAKYMTLRAMQESIELAKENGPYPSFNCDLFLKVNDRFFKEDCREIKVNKIVEGIKKYGIRNSAVTSIAPTGTISFIAGISGGIEPVFSLAYTRKVEKANKEYDKTFILDPIFENYLNKNFDNNKKEKIIKNIIENKGSCQKCKDISDNIKNIFMVSSDLTPEQHLNILKVVANNTSLSVSKTINMLPNAKVSDISDVFIKAHEMGIIGVTVYRDGCRDGILTHGNQENSRTISNFAFKRPEELQCDVWRITAQGERWIVFIGLFDNKPFEVFAGKIDEVNLSKNIKNGFIRKIKSNQYAFVYEDDILIKNICSTFANETQEALTRMLSIALQNGTPISRIVAQLSKSKGNIVDFSKAIIQALKHYIKDGEEAGKCSRCGNKMLFTEGCMKCSNPECGESKCG